MRNEVSIFIFSVGILVFNWPFLRIFERALPVYLFIAWTLFIGIVMIYSLSRREPRGK